MASLAALRIALQGLFPLTPIAVAVQGLLGEDEDEQPPQQPEQPAGGGTSIGQPFHWVPFAPVAPKRPRKKRQIEVLFLGH